MQKCRCKTKQDAKTAYGAQLKLIPARKKEYRKCQLMKCVLDGVSMANCKLKELKELKKRKLTKETEEASCEEEKAKREASLLPSPTMMHGPWSYSLITIPSLGGQKTREEETREEETREEGREQDRASHPPNMLLGSQPYIEETPAEIGRCIRVREFPLGIQTSPQNR